MFIINKKLWLKLLHLTAEKMKINKVLYYCQPLISLSEKQLSNFILIHIHNDSDKLKTEN